MSAPPATTRRHREIAPWSRDDGPAGCAFSRRAFTLIEILISVTLLALLSVMLLAVMEATTSTWRWNENRVDSYREARAALNVMSREIRTLYSRNGSALPVFWLDPPIANVTRSADVAGTNRASSAFFLTLLPATAQNLAAGRSDLCSVGYYLAWTRDRTPFHQNIAVSGSGSYKIFRTFRGSDATFSNLSGGLPLWMANPLTDSEILARNIVDFRVRTFERSYSAGNYTGLVERTPWPVAQRPAEIELTITAINSQSSVRLGGSNTWTATHPLVTASLQSFTTRIALPE